MRNNPLRAARSQIAWILALVISSAIVVRLEQVDFEGRLTSLAANPFQVETATADALLAQVEASDWGSSDLHVAQKATALALLLMSGPASDKIGTDAGATLAETRARVETASPADRPMLELAATLLTAALDRKAFGD